MVIRRFDVYLVELDPTVGAEMQKTRPCLVVSPDDVNFYLDTVLIAPMTSRTRSYPTRVDCRFQGRDGEIALDQIRAVDKTRLIRRLGQITSASQKAVFETLAELFSE